MICKACEFPHDELDSNLLCPHCREEATRGGGEASSLSPAVPAVAKLQLRGYQARMVNATNEALRTRNRVVTVAPTGAGKRYVGVWYAQKIQNKGRRVLMAMDRRLLVRQMFDELDNFGVKYGVIMAGEPRHDAPTVQVASIQTLQSRHLKTGEGLPEADWLIVDEAHKMPAQYRRLFEHYPNAKVMGLTATPVGPQGRTLIGDGYYEQIVNVVPTSELVDNNWLLRIRVFAPSEIDLKGVAVSGGQEYNQAELGTRVEQFTAFADVYREWEKHRDRQCIIFAPLVAYCRGLAKQFNHRYGEGTAEVIEGGTNKFDRADMFKRFDDGSLRILVSVDVLKEGFDCSASLGIDLQPNIQLRSYVQKTGRIRRPRGTHKDAVWIDLAGNYWRFPHPDEDIDWNDVTEKQTTQDLIRQQREAKTKAEPIRCPGCGGVPLTWPDGKCPMCGYAHPKRVRYVRMGDGRVKEVPVEHKRKAQKSADQKAWDAARYRAHYTGRTLKQAMWLFKQQTGYWPPAGLNYMPAEGSLDWQLLPADVYPFMQRRRKTVT